MSILCKQKRKPFSYIDPCLYAICLFLLRSSVSGSPNSDCYLFHNFIPNAIFQQNSHVCGLNVCNLQQELIRTPSIQYWGPLLQGFPNFYSNLPFACFTFFPLDWPWQIFFVHKDQTYSSKLEEWHDPGAVSSWLQSYGYPGAVGPHGVETLRWMSTGTRGAMTPSRHDFWCRHPNSRFCHLSPWDWCSRKVLGTTLVS